jgi:hypothetical protein
MPNALRLIALVLAVTLGACGQKAPENADNQDLAIEDNLVTGLPANADIETLPPDESSGTSPAELNAGDDNPDVNDLGNGN